MTGLESPGERRQSYRDGEGVFESDRGKEHLDADEEVLVAGGHSAGLGDLAAVVRYDGVDGPHLLQDDQQETLQSVASQSHLFSHMYVTLCNQPFFKIFYINSV